MLDSTFNKKGFTMTTKTATKTKKSTKTSKSTKTATKAVKEVKKEDEHVSFIDYKKNIGQKGRNRLQSNEAQIVPSFDNLSKKKGIECRAMSCIMLYLSLLNAKAKKINLSTLLKECLSLEQRGKYLDSYKKLYDIAISDNDFVSFFIKEFKVDFVKIPNFNDNVIHQSMYAMSKVETNETITNKEGKLVDSFSAGAREFFRRDVRCGIKSTGKYSLNPNYRYELHNIEKVDARTMGLSMLRQRTATEKLI